LISQNSSCTSGCSGKTFRGSYSNFYGQNPRLGWLYFLAKNYTASATYYQKAIDQRPYTSKPKFGLVKPLNALGQVECMLGLYAAMLQVDP
jgi:hypothetical protein